MTLVLHLPDEREAELNERAKAEGLSSEQWAQKLLEQALKSPAENVPLAERIRGIWAEMPEAVRAKLPTDGASQHDHYIYGVSKIEP